MASICIPVKGSADVVEVVLDDLPEDADDIIFILQEEQTARDLFHRFALEYYKRQNEAGFLQLTLKGLEDRPYFQPHDAKDPQMRIALNNCQAAFYMQKASHADAETDRARFLEQATVCFNTSDRWNDRDPSTWLGKALLLLMEGKLDQADYHLKFVLEQEPDHLAALVARGCVLYRQARYADALAVYQRVLSMFPDMQVVDVRVGIGLCYAHLHMLDLAKFAFERVLQRNPKNVIALSLLATLHFNAAKEQEGLQAKQEVTQGVKLLKQAQSINKTNALVQLQLSEIQFHKGEVDKSLALAKQVLKSGHGPLIHARAYFYVGRVFHQQGRVMDALQNYQSAVSLDPTLGLAFFHLAQSQLERGNVKEAAKHIQKCTELCGWNVDCEKIAAHLLARKKQDHPKAIEKFQKLTKEAPDDLDCWIELAQLLETVDMKESIAAYQNANKIMVDRGEISLQMLNNLAALFHSGGDLENAEKAYEKAISLCETRAQVDTENRIEYDEIKVTLLYNLGRLAEQQQKYDRADELFKDVLEKCPNYIDATLRRGCVLQSRQQNQDAADMFKDALALDEGNPDTWTLLANLDLCKKAYRPAKGSFERILKNIDRNDTYALIALANDRLFHARNEAKPDLKHNYYKEAVKLLDKVLREDPKNLYAAHGLAIALAETGHLAEAKDTFGLVREADVNFMPAQVNLAHVLMEMGQYGSAITLYEAINAKFGESKDPQLSLYTARALYIKARVEKRPEEMLQCAEHLKSAMEMLPNDLALAFNLALTKQQYAQLVCDQAAEMCTLEQLKQAETFIDAAKQQFSELKDGKGNAHQLGYDPQMAKQREKHCEYVRNNVVRRLTQQRANEEIKRDKLLELKRAREIEEEQRIQREKEEMEARMEKEERLRQQRLEMQDKLLEQQKEFVAQKGAAKEKRQKKKRKKEEEADGSEEGEESMPVSPAIERPSAATEDEPAVSNKMETEEGRPRKKENPAGRKKLKKRKTESDNEKEDQEDAPTSPKVRKESVSTKVSKKAQQFSLSEDYIHSSDEDSDENKRDKEEGGPAVETASHNKKSIVIEEDQ